VVLFILLVKIIEQIKLCLYEIIGSLYPDLSAEFDLSKISIEIPAERIHGELSSNIAFVYAKKIKTSPKKIACALADDFQLRLSKFNENYKKNNLKISEFQNKNLFLFIDKAEAAGAGFINFFFNFGFYLAILTEISKEKENYGNSNFGLSKSVLIEFVSANPTGPMHAGNARLGIIGDVLAQILKVSGFKVCKEFYVNDAGNQIKKMGESLAARYRQIFEPGADFPEDGYSGKDISEHAGKFASVYGDKFLENENLENLLINYVLPKNIEKMKENLEKYKIFYDNWFFESEIYKNNGIEKIIRLFKEKGLIYKKDGAVWFKTSDFNTGKDGGNESPKDEVLIRANGTPTYFAADIAYHANKFLTRKFDICINVWGADHHGHISRMKSALQALGVDPGRLKIIIVQLVRLIKNGKPYRMSKRAGDMQTLESLIETASADAARFIFGMQNVNSKMDFDIDIALKNDNINPVYYVQYAFARIKSIVNLFEKQNNLNFNKISEANLSVLDSEEERNLIFALANFPKEILEAAKFLDPAKISGYSINLSSVFHKFYNAKKVLCENEKIAAARIFLCIQTAQVIKNALSILKVKAPDYM
jgi:arginyl-tRNA synthetase